MSEDMNSRSQQKRIAAQKGEILVARGQLEEAKYWRDWLRTQPISELPTAIDERIKLLEEAK